jgi:hypothetical protein
LWLTRDEARRIAVKLPATPSLAEIGVKSAIDFD